MKKHSYASLQDFLNEINEPCLLLARHGETDWNAAKIIQGQQDRPLNFTGYEQRKNLFFLLEPVILKEIYSSKLQRTIQTAMPISIAKNIKLKKKLALNEIKLGIFEGLHKEVFSDEFSRNTYQEFLNDEVNVVLPGGGENLRMVAERVKTVVENSLNVVKELGHVLIVGHRNTNKMIVKKLLNLTFEEGYEVEHKNDWLYVFVPKSSKIYLIKIPAPYENIEVQEGYKKVAVLYV